MLPFFAARVGFVPQVPHLRVRTRLALLASHHLDVAHGGRVQRKAAFDVHAPDGSSHVERAS